MRSLIGRIEGAVSGSALAVDIGDAARAVRRREGNSSRARTDDSG
jgi:hypothetical protein